MSVSTSGIPPGLVTGVHLALDRCPHCGTANPTLSRRQTVNAQAGKGVFLSAESGQYLQWHIYICESCAGLVAAGAIVAGNQLNFPNSLPAVRVVPGVGELSADIPPQPRRYLTRTAPSSYESRKQNWRACWQRTWRHGLTIFASMQTTSVMLTWMRRR